MIATLSRRIPTDFGTVEIKWDGRPLGASFLAIDTETEVIEDRAKVPRLVLASASDGGRHVIVAEDQVADFLLAHADKLWIMFNAAFDFWVLHEHLGHHGNDAAKQLLWDKADNGELRDGMLLAQLVAIARGAEPTGRGFSLGDLADKHGVVGVDKNADAHYRMGYAQLIGRDLADVEDPGWFVYAARDAAATLEVYDRVLEEALTLSGRLGVAHDTIAAWGPLTETVQVRAAIALTAATRRGFGIDARCVEQTRSDLRVRIRELAMQIEETISQDHGLSIDDRLFKYGDDGELDFTDAGAPRKSTKSLQLVLLQIKQLVDPGDRLDLPRQPKGGGITTKAEDWRPLSDSHLAIKFWLELEKQRKTLSLLPKLGDRVHPRYRVLVKTGRTSSSRPNIQQVPRDGAIRGVYVPSPGHVLVGADYNCIEMVTLAQVCLDRFGISRVAELLHRGYDLHAYTAARLLDKDYEEFLSMKATEPGEFGKWRQRAKAINFGVPGGMGAAALRDYAASTYGVTLTKQEARDWRQTLIDEVFPELSQYLHEDTLGLLAGNLGCSTDKLRWGVGGQAEHQGWLAPYLRRLIEGHRYSRNGSPYSEHMMSKAWDVLEDVSQGSESAVSRHHAGPALAERLFQRTIGTPTGRLRGGCTYAAARNTAFQGLAADGAKLALFELARRGYHIVAFIHDEILIEVRADDDPRACGEELGAIMCEQMRRVVPDVAVSVGDPVIMERWEK